MTATTEFPSPLAIIRGFMHEAHDGVFRDGVRPATGEKVPYKEHPERVHYILEQVIGNADPVLLGGSDLHDVMEDVRKYNNPAKLTAALLARGLEPAFVAEVVELCDALKNARHMEEGKRTWQVDHIRGASDRAKLVKIADQIANLIDILELPGPISVDYVNKARDVYKASSGVNKTLDETFKLVYAMVRNTLEHNTMEERSGITVDIDAVIATAKTRAAQNLPASAPAGSDAERYITDPHWGEREQGVVAIGMNQAGDVVHYSMVVTPGKGKADPANAMAENLRRALEQSPRRRVTTGNSNGLDDDSAVRSFALKPSLDRATFVQKAQGMLSPEMARAAAAFQQR